jgi:hypothetical protein
MNMCFITVTARSNSLGLGRSTIGIVSSNANEGMVLCPLLCCVVLGR